MNTARTTWCSGTSYSDWQLQLRRLQTMAGEFDDLPAPGILTRCDLMTHGQIANPDDLVWLCFAHPELEARAWLEQTDNCDLAKFVEGWSEEARLILQLREQTPSRYFTFEVLPTTSRSTNRRSQVEALMELLLRAAILKVLVDHPELDDLYSRLASQSHAMYGPGDHNSLTTRLSYATNKIIDYSFADLLQIRDMLAQSDLHDRGKSKRLAAFLCGFIDFDTMPLSAPATLTAAGLSADQLEPRHQFYLEETDNNRQGGARKQPAAPRQMADSSNRILRMARLAINMETSHSDQPGTSA